ncbi:hypothetical protein [Oceanobacillus rekensis]|uniref:hypothetical protein n=1 Tax=Oceanobacillus rekensis TaxID=937927 RepID=UPI000B44A87A|nr:hypothetical protein [Oceanobacillus rekensis]
MGRDRETMLNNKTVELPFRKPLTINEMKLVEKDKQFFRRKTQQDTITIYPARNEYLLVLDTV